LQACLGKNATQLVVEEGVLPKLCACGSGNPQRLLKLGLVVGSERTVEIGA
jgi:hypothetical protein